MLAAFLPVTVRAPYESSAILKKVQSDRGFCREEEEGGLAWPALPAVVGLLLASQPSVSSSVAVFVRTLDGCGLDSFFEGAGSRHVEEGAYLDVVVDVVVKRGKSVRKEERIKALDTTIVSSLGHFTIFAAGPGRLSI